MRRTPLSLYIHIPFCKSRCNYCDFLSFEGREDCIPAYVDALCDDIANSGKNYKHYGVVTVFFGGGTPTLLAIHHLERILQTVKDNFYLELDCKFSVEANPDTVDGPYLVNLRKLGFERISFGVQSFHPLMLTALGRAHKELDGLRAIGAANKAGFKDINIDLMFATPFQLLENFEVCLDAVAWLPVTHVSCYALTVEEGTPLAEDKSLLRYIPNEKTDRAMYALAKEKLAAAGFKHYEISNWAKPGYQCYHNIGYWTSRQYLGLGLGASSYIQNCRLKKTDCLQSYIDGDHELVLIEELCADAQAVESIILGLRLTEGVDVDLFEGRFEGILDKFLQQDLLCYVNDGNKVALTDRGLDLSNTVFKEFLL